MNSFTYNIPTKVYFGDQLSLLGKELKKYGKRVLLTYGGGSIKKSGLYKRIKEIISGAGLELYELGGIAPNPRIESVRKGAEMCKANKIDVLLAVGGGSTLDATKYMAAGAKVDHDPWLFFTERAPIKKALPVVTVLTLAATGSEMNGGGVISNRRTREKLGRMEDILRPKASFLDPTLTYTVSKFQTAAGAADILSHVMETYFTTEPDLYMLDGIMETIMKTVIKFAPVAMREPENYEARAELMWASSWAINGLITGGKTHAWSVHPIEHELSAFYDITHGLGLAILTPRWLKYCLNKDTTPRIAQFGVNVFGINPALAHGLIAKRAIEMLSDFLYKELGLQKTLTELEIGTENFEKMAKKSVGESGVINGFVALNADDVEEILNMCI